MKRALAALAALLLALPAAAQTRSGLMFITYPTNGPDNWYVIQQQDFVAEWYRARGVDVDIYPAASLKTRWAADLAVPLNASGTIVKRYAGAFHWGATPGSGMVSYPNGYGVRPDSMVKITFGKWPEGPSIWCPPLGNGANLFTQSATCSLGTSGHTVGHNAGRDWYTYYKVGSRRAWKQPSGTVFISGVNVVKSPSRTGTIFRPLVGVAPAGITGTASLQQPQLDDITRSDDPDSVALWYLARGGGETGGWIVGNFGGGWVSEELLRIAAALQDSISGHAIFTDNSAFPKPRAAVLRNGLARGTTGNFATLEGGGCQDDAQCRRGADSLRVGFPVPITVGIRADSAAAYPEQVALINAIPMARVAIEPYSGTIAGRGANSSASQPMDPFGHLRVRQALPAGFSTWPPDCSTDTTSSVCTLSRLLALANAAFPGRVDASVIPPFGDWSNAATGSQQAGDLANLFWAIRRLGIRTVLLGHSITTSNPGRHYSIANGMEPSNSTAPDGWFTTQRAEPILEDITSGRVIGFLKFARARSEGVTSWSRIQAGHSIPVEFAYGQTLGRWYGLSLARGDLYHHDLNARTDVIAYTIGQLGGDGTNFYPEAYFALHWMNEAMEAANEFGTTLDRWVYLSELRIR